MGSEMCIRDRLEGLPAWTDHGACRLPLSWVERLSLPTLNAERDPSNVKGRVSAIWEFWAPFLFTVSLYLLLRQFAFEARYIPSGSMLPGLQVGDKLIVEKLSYRSRPPQRGRSLCSIPPVPLIPSGNWRGGNPIH